MILRVNQNYNRTLKLFHYKGSLDYDCEFCKRNCYDNFHLEIDGLKVVFCLECFNKIKGD